MKIALFLAAWKARQLEAAARRARRALRDVQRLELSRIHRAEKRARGLRIFIGWSKPKPEYLVGGSTHVWRAQLDQAA